MKVKDEKGNEVTQKDNLLWVEGKILNCIHADRVAALYGFYCAEQLVREMQKPEDQQKSGYDK